MRNMRKFCPEWGVEIGENDEIFCEGCEYLCANYTYKETVDIYEANERLKIGL